MRKPVALLTVLLVLLAAAPASAQESSLDDAALSGLSLRPIGPALNGGRIADIKIHPHDESIMYVAVGSGGVWKTTNAGTTWTPIFDEQGSYSIGSLAIDPSAPDTIWVGTGENVGGRHVGFGDGIYKSTDGGRTWRNMGLGESEHLSTIVVHPDNSDIVWVAAQGPLWSSGGQRGLYYTADGGETWHRALGSAEWTGATDVVVDPRNPDRIYAATWDRHRTVAALMGGGPGSGIWKSEDGGESWKQLTTGLPGSPLGKIGLAISPQQPDIVYTTIETIRGDGGVWMSEDRGESWRKMSDAVSGGTGPHYYQELFASPHQSGRLFIVSATTLVTDDHFATYYGLNNDDKHGDDHAIAFRNSDPDYIIVGSDGGLYESFDGMKTWRYLANLPVMQYYKIAVDDSGPFYNVYGGTQDNGSNGGPIRTPYSYGIRNHDWFTTLGADGQDQAVEPGNPNIHYGEFQQGVMWRTDRTTGEAVFIQPQAREGEPFERFNWDAPIEVSFHQPTRILTGSYRVWRSDDRGDSWTPISGDLTRNQERIELPIMGRKQSWEGAWDVGAMSVYNTITSIGESPLDEQLIYAGTDDGLVSVTDDGGDSWRRIEVGDMGVPERAFVNDIKAGHHDANTVFVALDNHKYGDFAPYLVKSTDRGTTWTSIAGNLPDRHLVWRVVQDHVDPDLLFAATEFGVFFTIDGGGTWTELPGAPTISFRDIVIQRQQEDLVAASFGRGIFVLDDYTPLREGADGLQDEAMLFDTRPALWFMPKDVQHSQGADQWTADNPPFGAVFTYWLRDSYATLEQQRKEREGEIAEDEDVPFPGWDALEAEMREQAPKVQVVIRDRNGTVIERVDGPTSAGVHRVAWDFAYSSDAMIGLEGGGGFGGGGFLALPDTYTATLIKIDKGVVSELAGPVDFDVVPVFDGALERVSPDVVMAFREEVTAFALEMTEAGNLLEEQIQRVEAMQTALNRADSLAPELNERLYQTRLELLELREQMRGSEAKGEIGERNPPSPSSRLFVGYRGLRTMYGPTEMHRRSVQVGKTELAPIRAEIERYADEVVPSLQQALEATGAPPIER